MQVVPADVQGVLSVQHALLVKPQVSVWHWFVVGLHTRLKLLPPGWQMLPAQQVPMPHGAQEQDAPEPVFVRKPVQYWLLVPGS